MYMIQVASKKLGGGEKLSKKRSKRSNPKYTYIIIRSLVFFNTKINKLLTCEEQF